MPWQLNMKGVSVLSYLKSGHKRPQLLAKTKGSIGRQRNVTEPQSWTLETDRASTKTRSTWLVVRAPVSWSTGSPGVPSDVRIVRLRSSGYYSVENQSDGQDFDNVRQPQTALWFFVRNSSGLFARSDCDTVISRAMVKRITIKWTIGCVLMWLLIGRQPLSGRLLKPTFHSNREPIGSACNSDVPTGKITSLHSSIHFHLPGK